MKIYTKKGDTGETGLLGGARVRKTHPRIEAYGTLDELNSVLGVAVAILKTGPIEGLGADLIRIQGEIFSLGAELATPAGRQTPSRLIDESDIQRLETSVDAMEEELAPLSSFILPGGSILAAQIHIARTIARRAERATVEIVQQGESLRPEVLRYLNRLSDYLFVVARFVNLKTGDDDVAWRG